MGNYVSGGEATAKAAHLLREDERLSTLREQWSAVVADSDAAERKHFVARLRAAVADTVSVEDERYQELRRRPFFYDARGWPLAFVLARDERDVQAVLQLYNTESGGKAERVPSLAVSGGRHSHACCVDNTVVLCLERLKHVHIDAKARTARVGGGARLEHVDAAAAPHCLALPTGTNGDTGVGGLTLSGGWGFLARKYGLSVDCVRALRVVTGNGELIEATAHNEHADLFWGARGGGGNFGVVVEFTFALVPMRHAPLVAEMAHVAPTRAAFVEIVQNFDTFLRNEKTGKFGGALVLPCGAPIVPVVGAWYDHNEEDESKDGEGAVAAAHLRQSCAVPAELKEFDSLQKSWPWFRVQRKWQRLDHHKKVQCLIADQQQPCFAYIASLSLMSLNRRAIEILFDLTRTNYPNSSSLILLCAMGGKIKEPEVDSAVPYRDALYWVAVEAKWSYADGVKGYEKAKQWCKEVREKLSAVTQLAGTSHASEEDVRKEEEAETKTWEKKIEERLKTIKKRYDEKNILRMNRNIK